MTDITELYLSSVLNKTVINEAGASLGKLWDLVIAPAEPLPIVTQLLLKAGKNTYAVPWNKVLLFNQVVVSASGTRSTLETYIPQTGTSLLKRDVLDKQIVDVNGAKVVRVNDVKMIPYQNSLSIFSADIGLRGLLRRLGYEQFLQRIIKDIPHQEIGWQFVNILDANASHITLSKAREQLNEMHPADLADIIANIPRHNIQQMLESLDTETAGEAIHELDPDLRSQIISQLNSDHASDILEEMDPDEAADVLGDLPEEKAKELLGLMDAGDAEDIQELMEHADDTVGGLMTNEFIAITAGMTVGEALQTLRNQAEETEMIFYAYVLDEDEKLLGVASIRELLITEPSTLITDIMTEQIKRVSIDSEPEDILEIIAKYDLFAVPVIDQDGKMAGVVTIDDIVELFLPYALKRKRHPS